MAGDWWEREPDSRAQDADAPSVAPPWNVQTRRGASPPPGTTQEPGEGATPEALALADLADATEDVADDL